MVWLISLFFLDIWMHLNHFTEEEKEGIMSMVFLGTLICSYNTELQHLCFEKSHNTVGQLWAYLRAVSFLLFESF